MRTIRTRFLVVGSGAAGSVLAYHLARRGEQVLLLERGRWFRPDDIDHDELRMLGSLYKDGGTQTNTAGDMFVLQGSCVGGSTLLTNGVCFRLPEQVRRSWANEGFEIGAADLDASFRRVEAFLGIQPTPDRILNAGVEVAARGAAALGLTAGRFRKNLRGCTGCGYCNLGCPYGRKMDASVTWIPRAVEQGLRVLPQHEVVRVVVRRGRVDCVLARDLWRGDLVRVVAERTVLCAGAVATPEILLRSGIQPGLAGRRASFNVGSIVVAEMPGEVDAWRGDSMSFYVPGEGFVIEQVQNPPMAFALTLPGTPATHHERLGRYRRLVAAGVLIATPPVGRVRLGRLRALSPRLTGRARIDFRLPGADLNRLKRGFRTLAELFLAAGAERVFPPVRTDLELRGPRDLGRLDAAIARQGDVPGFGSAHPQGGAVAGADPRRHPVGPDFRVRGVEGLYVMDASVFPSSVEVNPQLSVMAVADHAVRSIGGFAPSVPEDLRPRAPASTPHEDGLRFRPPSAPPQPPGPVKAMRPERPLEPAPV